MTAVAASTEGILDLRALGEVALSPDGGRVALGVSSVDRDSMADTSRIVVCDVESGTSRFLTDAGGLDLQPSWSADGSAVYVRALSPSGFQIERVEVEDGSRRPITDEAHGVAAAAPRCAPDGTVAFTAPTTAPRDPAEPYVVDTSLWRVDGVGLLRDAVAELFVQEAGHGAPRQLTGRGDRIFVTLEWSPAGERLLAVSLKLGDVPSWELSVHDRDGGERVLWTSEFLFFPPAAAWLPDGRILRTTDNRLGIGSPVGVVAVDVEGRHETRYDLPDWAFGLIQSDFPGFLSFVSPRIVVDPASGDGFVAVQRGGSGEVWRLEGDGGAHPVVAGECVAVPVGARGGRLVIASTTFHEPPDLWVVEGRGRRRLTTLNAELFPDAAAFDVERLAVAAGVEGWFLRPRGTAGPVPTVVNLHGGPHAAWGASFSYDDCMLTGAGYGVLLVNQRGSIGYSRELAQSVHRHWGDVDASDVHAAVDLAVSRGLADGERLGVWGISAGGFLSAWMTTHGSRFRAAVVENPCVDWTIMLSSDIGLHLEPWLGVKAGSGPEAAATFAGTSATTFAARSATPTLLIAHEHDLRTPRAGAEAFYTLLRMHGVEAKLLMMPGTSHQGSIDLGSPRVRVAQNVHLLDWFDTHLGRA